ncbi:MAG: hypothetical protein NTZ32_16720 [Planctomycetales bacterium]|nr:hypothetical protein [Planctomycetales bacterium]
MDMESLLGMKIIPIHALLDENCGLNPATDPRQKLGDAELIMVRDVMSRRQCLVFGKEIIRRVALSGRAEPMPSVMVELDMATDELPLLLAMVSAIKGRHDYT